MNPLLQLVQRTLQSALSPKTSKTSIPGDGTSVPSTSMNNINWSDPNTKISKYFTVKEALTLPSWGIMHVPSEDEKKAIVETALAMDKVREFIGTPISVTVWIRPAKVNCPGFDPSKIKISATDPKKTAKEAALKALNYNAFIGGASSSSHILGKAVDWVSGAQSCDSLRAKLLPKLAEFSLCMEDAPGSNWVHNDTMPPRGNTGRFFKP